MNSYREEQKCLKFLICHKINLLFSYHTKLDKQRVHKVVPEMLHKGIEFLSQTLFSNLYIFATQCRRPLIFQTMNSVRPNNLSLKYQRFTSSDCKDIGIKQFEFVTKTQFL